MLTYNDLQQLEHALFKHIPTDIRMSFTNYVTPLTKYLDKLEQVCQLAYPMYGYDQLVVQQILPAGLLHVPTGPIGNKEIGTGLLSVFFREMTEDGSNESVRTVLAEFSKTSFEEALANCEKFAEEWLKRKEEA